eukprot:gene6671-12227_t
MSPEMEAIYIKHGPGETKPRRRPDINEAVKESEDVKKESPLNKKSQPHREENHEPVTTTAKTLHDQAIHAGIVACGLRAPEAIISLKSFAMLSEKPLYFHVFAEDELHDTFKKEIQTWPGFKNGKIKLDLHTIQFPVEGNFHEWKKLFKPCASQRLFFPLLLKDVDSIIYVDTDVLMLRPPEDLWGFFSRFNNTQLAGMAPEGEVDAIGWYNRFARHPYYGRLGVNSGVMLMNLTRMRRNNWNDDVYPIYKHYRYDITWGDQDILNIMFHFKPGVQTKSELLVLISVNDK